jgi:hypothetical protein
VGDEDASSRPEDALLDGFVVTKIELGPELSGLLVSIPILCKVGNEVVGSCVYLEGAIEGCDVVGTTVGSGNTGPLRGSIQNISSFSKPVCCGDKVMTKSDASP